MNSTTWIILPNGLAWGLLIIATAALCLIALGTMRISFRKHSELGKPKSNGVNSRTCTTFSIIACVLALIAIGGTFLDIRSNDASIPISILGTFVAALIGWQIFNLIKIDRLKNSLEMAEQGIAEVKKDAQEDLYLHTALMMAIHSKNSINGFDLNKASKDYPSVSFAYSMAVAALRYSLEADTPRIAEGRIRTMAICIRIANIFNAWDEIFTKETSELAEKSYYPIMACLTLLTLEQVNNLEQIHYCRKHKQAHPSLRNM